MSRPLRDFVHLRMRSPYSMLEGALKIDETAKRAVRYRQPALAITDTNNLCGALEFCEKVSAAGVQPIIGVTLSLDLEDEKQPGQIHKEPDGTLVLLAQTEQGYGNLMDLSSAAFLEIEPTDVPHVKLSRLTGWTEGVIALTGGADGVLNTLIKAWRLGEAESWLLKLKALFPDRLYVELQRHTADESALTEVALIDLAYKHELPLVATNEPYFLDPDMHEAHDVLLAMNEGSYVLEKDRRQLSMQHYFKSSEEMIALFKDLPEAIENTMSIAERCAYRVPKHAPILPNFGDGSYSEDELLVLQAKEGLEKRLATIDLFFC